MIICKINKIGKNKIEMNGTLVEVLTELSIITDAIVKVMRTLDFKDPDINDTLKSIIDESATKK